MSQKNIILSINLKIIMLLGGRSISFLTVFFLLFSFELFAFQTDSLEVNYATNADSAILLVKQAKENFENNPDTAIYFATQAILKAKNTGDINNLADAQYYLAESYYNKNEFKNAITEFKASQKNYLELNKLYDANIINKRLGLTYYYLGNYELSIKAYQNAIEYFAENNDNLNLAMSYHNLGMVYGDLKDPNGAISYYKKAQAIYIVLGDTEMLAALYQNIGVAYAQLENDTRALENYQRSRILYEQLENEMGIAITKVNIGNIYKRKHEYQNAIDNYYDALAYFKKENAKWEIIQTLLDIGETFYETSYFPGALENLKEGLEMASEYNFMANELEFYEALASTYEKMGDYKNALIYYKESADLDEKIFRGESMNKIRELQTKYNVEVKERELAEKIAELRQNELQKLIYSIGFGLALLIVLFLIYNNYRKEKEKKALELLIDLRTKELKTEITERKIAEESDKLKSAFLSNMSHEIRTPMNAIISFSNFLKNPDLDEEQKDEYINYIVSSGNTLLRLIDDIIDSAKIESNQLKIQKSVCNINALMRELYSVFHESRIQSEKPEISLELESQVMYKNYIIHTDKVRLRQVLTNLLENAYKYTVQGKIEFGFSISKANYLIFHVRDTGIGISKDKEDKIFERFSRIEHNDHKMQSGTGLGLSISKDLVTLLGGKLWFSSEEDKGSTFFFTIPFNDIHEIEDDGDFNEPITSTGQFNWSEKLILVAEDDDLNYKILETIIKRNNGEIIRAEDGKRAVEYTKEHAFDLVLMDIQMPEMNGYEATREIKKMNVRLPIIAQTAFAMMDERTKCIDAGCDDYIVKPLNIEELQGKISKFLL